jgi:hypothetical protein
MAIGESEPTKYWLSTISAISAGIALVELVHLAKLRWIIERDYQELKQELGLGHYEDRAVGEAFIITYASRPMDSWWPNGIGFPLSPHRQSRITNLRAATRLPAAWFAASALISPSMTQVAGRE